MTLNDILRDDFRAEKLEGRWWKLPANYTGMYLYTMGRLLGLLKVEADTYSFMIGIVGLCPTGCCRELVQVDTVAKDLPLAQWTLEDVRRLAADSFSLRLEAYDNDRIA